jgi:hypothetical protein
MHAANQATGKKKKVERKTANQEAVGEDLPIF